MGFKVIIVILEASLRAIKYYLKRVVENT